MNPEPLLVVTIALLVSFLLAEIFYRFKYPRVIGQIMAGIILGIPFIRSYFNNGSGETISFLGELGIIFLLLLTGLEFNIHKFKKVEKDAILIAFSSSVIPFAFGFILMRAIGYGNVAALIVGAVLSVTAEGTTLKLLHDIRAVNTRVGTTLIGAGIFDDVLEILFLSTILFLSEKNIGSITLLPMKLIAFIAITWVTYRIFPRMLKVMRRERSRIATFSGVLIFCLIVASISQLLGLGPIVGAFIAGIIIHLSEHKKWEHHEIVKELQIFTFAFIVPFFFINIGLNFDYSSLTSNLWLTVIIVLVGTAGKLIGAMAVTPWTNFSLEQTHIIGWGMNSRGAVELVIAQIAWANGLITSEVYSGLVIMAILSTLSFPFVLKQMISKNKHVMD